MKNKKRVLSGIRATGRLHLGNYFGMVKPMVELTKDPKYEAMFMVADLHAMTTPYEPKKLKEMAREVVLDYLAVGLDPKKAIVFVQSEVKEHIELFYYFSTVMSIARMQHLPTFKEKVKQYPKNTTMALLNYPVLMASDILIYKTEGLPVGIDQEPHLEVAREIARKMNSLYGLKFPEPKRMKARGEYIPSLTGEGKMSKSVEGTYINLMDDLDTIKKKLAKVPTDSGKGKKAPEDGGVGSLLYLVELFEGKEKRKKYEKEYEGNGIRYGELKGKLAEVIYKELKPIQKRRAELEKKSEYIEEVLEDGAERAREIAKETLEEVREKMGVN